MHLDDVALLRLCLDFLLVVVPVAFVAGGAYLITHPHQTHDEDGNGADADLNASLPDEVLPPLHYVGSERGIGVGLVLVGIILGIVVMVGRGMSS